MSAPSKSDPRPTISGAAQFGRVQDVVDDRGPLHARKPPRRDPLTRQLAASQDLAGHVLAAQFDGLGVDRDWVTVHDDGRVEVTSRVTVSSRTMRPRTLVDGTLARTEVPSTHPPRYPVANGVTCIPLNELPALDRPGARFTVVGSGKTGIDAVLWLLEHDVPPANIRWIMPRDAWMLDRANFQMDPASFATLIGGMTAQLSAIAEASSVPDVYVRLERSGQLVRRDPAVEPTAYKCCTVSLAAGEVLVDCSARAVVAPPPLPVFEDGRINLLMVRTCQPTFSGALIGVVACAEQDTATRNAIVQPAVSPNEPLDWLRMWAGTIRNRVAWAGHSVVDAWLRQTRLDAIAIMARTVAPDDADRQAMLGALRETMQRAGACLPALLATAA
jgi:hypothetical protein